MKTVKISKSVTTIENAFIGNKSLTTVYIPNSVTSISDTFVNSSWENQPTNAVYIYTGKDVSVFAECTRFDGANEISASKYDPSATYTGINLVFGYSHCIAYNDGIHAEKVSDTIVTSYLESIKIVSKCVLCEMTEDNDSIAPLFTCLGYSAPTFGESGGIALGYTVNLQAINEYTEATGETLTYGVFAVAYENIGKNDVFDANGTPAGGVISAEISNREFVAFELAIVGFTDEYKPAKLAMGAYVAVTKDDTTTYSYMQDTTKGELIGNYYFASYNNVIGVE